MVLFSLLVPLQRVVLFISGGLIRSQRECFWLMKCDKLERQMKKKYEWVFYFCPGGGKFALLNLLSARFRVSHPHIAYAIVFVVIDAIWRLSLPRGFFSDNQISVTIFSSRLFFDGGGTKNNEMLAYAYTQPISDRSTLHCFTRCFKAKFDILC